MKPSDSPVLVVLSLVAVIGLIAALASFAASLRHRLPDMTWAWIVRSFLSKHTFTPRGQALRRRGWRLILFSVIAMFSYNLYATRVLKLQSARHKAAASQPAAIDGDIGR